jgi:hypothetical protein
LYFVRFTGALLLTNDNEINEKDQKFMGGDGVWDVVVVYFEVLAYMLLFFIVAMESDCVSAGQRPQTDPLSIPEMVHD